MRRFNLSAITIMAMLIIIALPACSKAKSPVEPAMGNGEAPVAVAESDSNRTVLAVYDAVIDPVARTFSVTPASDRITGYHFPLNSYYTRSLAITGYGWTPDFWVNIKLTHPYPGSGIDGFDPRVIAVVPAKADNFFYYSGLNAKANHEIVIAPDGYTHLFDEIDYGIPGNTNPFKAYFKQVAYRRWSSTSYSSETRRWDLDLSGFDGPMVFKLVVDVSTNYPKPAVPVDDNAPEPVEIQAQIGNLNAAGGTAPIEVTVLDWQGSTGVVVRIECPDVFSGVKNLAYNRPGTEPNTYIYTGTISNELLASHGEHPLLVGAKDTATGIYIFQEYKVYVVQDGIPEFPVDITPPLLNFAVYEFYVEGNYAYIAGGYTGLCIFDISDPVNPTLIKKVALSDEANDIEVLNGYAYISDGSSGIAVCDIDPPESAYLVKHIGSNGYYYVVSISNNILCSLSYYNNYRYCGIFDVSQPGNPTGGKTIKSPPDERWNDLCCSDGYVYIAKSSDDGIEVFDVDPIQSAHSVRKIYVQQQLDDIYVSNGVGAAAKYYAQEVIILDTSEPESTYIMTSVDTTHPWDIFISNGYAYLADDFGGLKIMDVDPPGAAHVVKTISTPNRAINAFVSNGYAYVGDGIHGFSIVDVDPIESANLISTRFSIFEVRDVKYRNSKIYIANRDSSFLIADFSMEVARMESDVCVGVDFHDPWGVDISGNYAYVTSDGRISVVDITSSESPFIVKKILCDSSGYPMDVQVKDGYAYVADGSAGLTILDIDPLDTAKKIKTVDTPHNAWDLSVNGDYAYVCGTNIYGMTIIKINPPESAYIVDSIGTYTIDAYSIGNYVYAADRNAGLYIIDVTNPEAASIINTVPLTVVRGVYVSNGYAYVSTSTGIQIVDIDPPESAYILSSIPGVSSESVYVSDKYCFVAGCGRGVLIYKLW